MLNKYTEYPQMPLIHRDPSSLHDRVTFRLKNIFHKKRFFFDLYKIHVWKAKGDNYLIFSQSGFIFASQG